MKAKMTVDIHMEPVLELETENEAEYFMLEKMLPPRFAVRMGSSSAFATTPYLRNYRFFRMQAHGDTLALIRNLLVINDIDGIKRTLKAEGYNLP